MKHAAWLDGHIWTGEQECISLYTLTDKVARWGEGFLARGSGGTGVKTLLASWMFVETRELQVHTWLWKSGFCQSRSTSRSVCLIPFEGAAHLVVRYNFLQYRISWKYSRCILDCFSMVSQAGKMRLLHFNCGLVVAESRLTKVWILLWMERDAVQTTNRCCQNTFCSFVNEILNCSVPAVPAF